MSAPSWDPLAREHAALRAGVKNKRRDAVAKTLGAVVMAAVVEAEGLRTAGADADAVATGLEQVVRERWPKYREEQWHFNCELCSDHGWRLFECAGDAVCGRKRRHGSHTYATPCWCERGKALQAKQQTEQDELAAVGKTKKARKFDRFGGR